MVRSEAVDLARKSELSEFEPHVVTMLADRNQFVLYAAIQYLGWVHEGEGIGATWLYPLLANTHPLVRIEAIESLWQIEDRAALPLIAKLLEDADELVRAYAAMALADSGVRKYRKLVERAAAKETTLHIQAHFARALFFFGDSSQFLRLIDLLQANHYLARCSAAHSLRDLPLNREQLEQAITAISNAYQNHLARADQSTMEKVVNDLRQELEAIDT